jgi:hypothetical protein
LSINSYAHYAIHWNKNLHSVGSRFQKRRQERTKEEKIEKNDPIARVGKTIWSVAMNQMGAMRYNEGIYCSAFEKLDQVS